MVPFRAKSKGAVLPENPFAKRKHPRPDSCLPACGRLEVHGDRRLHGGGDPIPEA